MHSLVVLLALMTADFLLEVLALWVGAHLVHSTHATWRRALLLQLVLLATPIALLAASQITLVSDAPIVNALQMLAALAIQLAATWFVIQRGLSLPAGKTAVVLGLRVGTTLAALVLVIMVVRPFLLEAFVTSSGSMSPTITGWHRQIPCTKCGGDVIVPLVTRRGGQAGTANLIPANAGICARCRLVTSSGTATGPSRGPDCFCVYKRGHVARWDIVAYQTPEGPLVCRVVGLPGETVHVADGDLFINGQKLPLPSELAGQTYTSPSAFPARYGSPAGPCILAPDEYFLLGDLSMIANDSRYRGPVKASAIIGVADLRYWPLSRLALLR